MADHLFPESTTYVHSYQPHEILTTPQRHVSAETSIFEYLPPAPIKKTPPKTETWTKLAGDSFVPPKEALGKKMNGKVQATTGNVDINDLTDDERAFFLSKTYRKTYDDYTKTVALTVVNQTSLKKPFDRFDDQMLRVLNATKPDLAYYGFGLPNKCCVAWGTAQSRTLPSEDRKRLVEKRTTTAPFPGYPEKMYPYIATGELSPHYDGSFPFGYTGHQRNFLEYPDDVGCLLRRDFPKYIPRNLTTNQATLSHMPVPKCENRRSNESGIK